MMEQAKPKLDCEDGEKIYQEWVKADAKRSAADRNFKMKTRILCDHAETCRTCKQLAAKLYP